MFFLENCCREWKWRTRKLMLDSVALIDKPHEMGTWPIPSSRSLLQMPRWYLPSGVTIAGLFTQPHEGKQQSGQGTLRNPPISWCLSHFLSVRGGANIWLRPRHCSASSKRARSLWHCGMRLLPVTAVRSPSSFLSINTNMISSRNVWACMSFKSTSCL